MIHFVVGLCIGIKVWEYSLPNLKFIIKNKFWIQWIWDRKLYALLLFLLFLDSEDYTLYCYFCYGIHKWKKRILVYRKYILDRVSFFGKPYLWVFPNYRQWMELRFLKEATSSIQVVVTELSGFGTAILVNVINLGDLGKNNLIYPYTYLCLFAICF